MAFNKNVEKVGKKQSLKKIPYQRSYDESLAFIPARNKSNEGQSIARKHKEKDSNQNKRNKQSNPQIKKKKDFNIHSKKINKSGTKKKISEAQTKNTQQSPIKSKNLSVLVDSFIGRSDYTDSSRTLYNTLNYNIPNRISKFQSLHNISDNFKSTIISSSSKLNTSRNQRDFLIKNSSSSKHNRSNFNDHNNSDGKVNKKSLLKFNKKSENQNDSELIQPKKRGKNWSTDSLTKSQNEILENVLVSNIWGKRLFTKCDLVKEMKSALNGIHYNID